MKYKFKNKNVLVVGLGKSGISSLEFLKRKGAFCFGYDDNILALKETIKTLDINIVNNVEESVVKMMDFVIISPGVSIFSEVVKLAKIYGIKVLGELELGLEFTKGKKILITGTNGKTTTCSLVAEILKTASKPYVLCGNIGEPLTENLMPFRTNYVVETSSFQLESSNRIKPDIAVITNLTSNHLNRHLTFENYKNAKFKIFENMSRQSKLILNYDDENLRSLKEQKVRPNLIWLSVNKEIEGYFVKDEILYLKKGKSIKEIISLKNVKLVGKHNLFNIAVACVICKILKVKKSKMLMAINGFLPLKHRLQFVKNVDGVDYVNDSKSTTPQSAITAINAFKKPLIIILGGSSKNTSFKLLAEKIKLAENIKLVVVQGETTNEIVSALNKVKFKDYIIADNMANALNIATEKSSTGDVVLLSPACASFDQFSNFEERGEKFIEYVEGLNEFEK